jgi:hypothetical protein
MISAHVPTKKLNRLLSYSQPHKNEHDVYAYDMVIFTVYTLSSCMYMYMCMATVTAVMNN